MYGYNCLSANVSEVFLCLTLSYPDMEAGRHAVLLPALRARVVDAGTVRL